MYTREPTKKSVIKMDPDCAICSAPATMSCDCEANGLERAIREAEDQVMRPLYTRVRYVDYQKPLRSCLPWMVISNGYVILQRLGSVSCPGLYPQILPSPD